MRKNVSVCCNTVDGFQGQEKDIIIFSCVRCEPNSFSSDKKRLNVALTRAKCALYVVGIHSLFKVNKLFLIFFISLLNIIFLKNCAVLRKLANDAEKRDLLLKLNINKMSSSVLSPLISK